MMNKALYCWICIISIQSYAQSNLKSQRKIDNLGIMEKTDFAAGYFGNMLWNPGLSFGAKYVIKEINKTKEKKWGSKTITHQFLLNGNLGFYWDPQSHSGLLNNYGILWQRTNHKGKQIIVEFNPVGLSRTFLPETYTIKNDNVEKVFLPGRFYYAPSLSIGLGKLRQGKKLNARYIKFNTTRLTPYNTHSLPMIFIAYGYYFNLTK